MVLRKIKNPKWENNTKELLSHAEDGIFNIDVEDGGILPYDWWLVEFESNFSGVIWVYEHQDPEGNNIAEISFYIDKEYRENGIAAQLIIEIEEIIKRDYLNVDRIGAIVKKTNPFVTIVCKILENEGYSPKEDKEEYIFFEKHVKECLNIDFFF